MKLHIAIYLLFFLSCGAAAAQKSTNPSTSWAPVEGGWAQFHAIVNFHGEPKSKEELAKANLRYLRIKCLIGGRVSGTLPSQVGDVRVIKIIYSEYGKFLGFDKFSEDTAEIYHSKNGIELNPVTIIRPASRFDRAEAAKPPSEVDVVTMVPTILEPRGVPAIETRRLSGQIYRLRSEWRRRGDTIEIRLKDYRP